MNHTVLLLLGTEQKDKKPVKTTGNNAEVLNDFIKRNTAGVFINEDLGLTLNFINELRGFKNIKMADREKIRNKFIEEFALLLKDQPDTQVKVCALAVPADLKREKIDLKNQVDREKLLAISEEGGIEEALRYHPELRTGLYMHKGVLASKALGDWFDLPYSHRDLFFGDL